MKKKLLFLLLPLFLTLVLGGYYFHRYKRALKTPRKLLRALPEIADDLDFQLDDVRYTHSRSGQKKWELKANRAIRRKNSQQIILEQVDAWIYPVGKLKGPTHVRAVRGIYYLKSGDIELDGQISIENKEFTISADRLRYDEASNRILVSGDIRLNSQKLVIRSKAVVIDLDKQRLVFTQGVETAINLESLDEQFMH